MLCVLKKESLGILRRRRTFVQLGVFLVIMSIVFLIGWTENARRAVGVRNAKTEIFIPVAFFQLLAILGVAAVASNLINSERERETWDILISSPLKTWRILLGKLMSPVLHILLIFAALLPMISLCFLLGGLSPTELLGTYTILGATALLASALGLFLSANMTGANAARTGTLLLLLYSVGMPFLRPALSQLIFDIPFEDPPVEMLFSPLYSFFILLIGNIRIDCPMWMLQNPHLVFLAGALPITLFLLVLTHRRIVRLSIKTPVHATRRRIVTQNLDNLIKKKGIKDGWNPVWIKERISRRGRILVARPCVVRTAFFLIGLLIGLSTARYATGLNAVGAYVASTLSTLAVICFTSLTVPALTIVGERDRKTWDFLKGSTLSSWRIVIGKALGSAEEILLGGMWFFMGLAGVLYADLIFFHHVHVGLDHLLWLFVYGVLVVSCVVFYVCAGIYFSAQSGHVSRAYFLNFTTVFMHTLGPFIGMIVFQIVFLSLLGAFFSTVASSVNRFFLFFTPFGLLMPDAAARKPDWGPGTPGWEMTVLMHSVLLLTLAVFLAYLANRRICRCDS